MGSFDPSGDMYRQLYLVQTYGRWSYGARSWSFFTLPLYQLFWGYQIPNDFTRLASSPPLHHRYTPVHRRCCRLYSIFNCRIIPFQPIGRHCPPFRARPFRGSQYLAPLRLLPTQFDCTDHASLSTRIRCIGCLVVAIANNPTSSSSAIPRNPKPYSSGNAIAALPKQPFLLHDTGFGDLSFS